jgi:hypothetical protein
VLLVRSKTHVQAFLFASLLLRAGGWEAPTDDREAENEHDEEGGDGEASLGSLDQHDDQTRWGLSSRSDREQDASESGIGDIDGLLEQIGSQDGKQGEWSNVRA